MAIRNPNWTHQEIATLRDVYPVGGMPAAMASLPRRPRQAIYVKANRLGLHTEHRPDAPQLALRGEQLQQAMDLRAQGWGCERIGNLFGMAEMTVSNAVIIEEGRRKGYAPLARDQNGRLLPASIETMRLLMRKGWKSRDIQERCGVSASCVAEQRRRYQRDLKARGKAAMPPPGGGQAYSGKRVSRADRLRVEQLYMEGLGATKIVERTGVSYTTVQRIRQRLVKRLRRKGEALPGCDASGRRRTQASSARFIPPELIDQLRARILARDPVIRAASELGIGGSSAYKIRDKLRAELEARGQTLPNPVRPGRVTSTLHPSRTAKWLPTGAKHIYRYGQLLATMPADQAKAAMLAEIEQVVAADRAARQAEAARPLTFEEQLERVRAGRATLVANIPMPTRALPDMTLGGVATGQLA